MQEHINIYYINLQKSIERNNNMQEQFKYMNKIFKNKRIEGVDGTTEDLSKYILINADYYKNSELHDNSCFNKVKKQQIACFTSHLYAIKSAYDDSLNEVIITEDDINLKILNFTYDKLAYLWTQHKDVEIIQLYSSGRDIIPKYTEAIKNNTLKLIPKIYEYWGCCAYLINRKGMEKVLSYFDKSLNKFDLLDIPLTEILVSDSFIYKSCNTMISCLPFINILNPEKNESTIGLNTQNKDRINTYKKILNELFQNKSNKFSLHNRRPATNLNITKERLIWMNEEIWWAETTAKIAPAHFNWINNNTDIIIKIIQNQNI